MGAAPPARAEGPPAEAEVGKSAPSKVIDIFAAIKANETLATTERQS